MAWSLDGASPLAAAAINWASRAWLVAPRPVAGGSRRDLFRSSEAWSVFVRGASWKRSWRISSAVTRRGGAVILTAPEEGGRSACSYFSCSTVLFRRTFSPRPPPQTGEEWVQAITANFDRDAARRSPCLRAQW